VGRPTCTATAAPSAPHPVVFYLLVRRGGRWWWVRSVSRYRSGHATPCAASLSPAACPAPRACALRSTSPRASASSRARADACHCRPGEQRSARAETRPGGQSGAAGPGPGKGGEAGRGGTRGPSLSGHRCPAPCRIRPGRPTGPDRPRLHPVAKWVCSTAKAGGRRARSATAHATPQARVTQREPLSRRACLLMCRPLKQRAVEPPAVGRRNSISKCRSPGRRPAGAVHAGDPANENTDRPLRLGVWPHFHSTTDDGAG